MRRLLQLLFLLILLGLAALVGYAYLGDLTPQTQESRIDVTLPGQPAPAPTTEAPSGN